ncbi:MAG TPA: trypsin-like serine protease [Polyangia bacterium]|jgi:hypothetical protein|nr:trypsin-like serine protease [Polyangia bacterium]
MKFILRASMAGAALLALAAGCSDLYGPDQESLSEGGQASPIINGSTASAYPESALVNMSKNGQVVAACSGSVIAPSVVLTAGHCVAGFTGWSVRAPFAQNQTSTSTSGETFDWKDTGSENVNPNAHDIGLVYLASPINLATFPALAGSALADGSQVVDLGRINNGTLSSTALFVSSAITVRGAANQGFPFDYVSTDVIESGDSGGPVEVPGLPSPHKIVAVNSGAGSGTQVLARVDLLASWIAGKIAAHGGGGNTTTPPPTTPPPPPPPPPPATCKGPTEVEPNNDFQHPNALGASVCGTIGAGDAQDWYSWSIAGATPYRVQLTASGDAAIAMWKNVGGTFRQVAGTSNTLIANTASGAGSYVVAVFSSTGQSQSYTLTLTK